jgi:FKBP-type peptidyl-prolyl cis-trans isomerase (trigger factor)
LADRLTLTRAFEDGGIKRDAAERIATEILDSIHENVVTKADLRLLEQQLDRRFEQLDQKFERRFEQLDQKFERCFEQLDQKFELRLEQVDRRIDRTVVRLGALVVIVVGLLFAALQRWPPH